MKLVLLLFSLSIFLVYLGQSQAKIDSLLQQIKTVKNEKKAEIFNQLSNAYLFSSADTASKYANQALKYARDYDNHLEEIYALKNIAAVFKSQNNYYEALNNYFTAIKIGKTSNYSYEVAETYNNIGGIYWRLNDYEKTLHYCLKSLIIYERLYSKNKKIEYKNGISGILHNIGMIYLDLSAHQKSLYYSVKSLKISQEIYSTVKDEKYKYNIANSLNSIGIIYKDLKKHKEALNFYHKALKIFEELEYSRGIAGSLNNIGMTLIKSEDYNSALEYLSKSYEIGQTTKDNRNISNTLVNIGYVYMKIEEYEKAYQYFTESLELATNAGSKEVIMENYLYLSEFYSIKNKMDQAYNYHLKYSAIKDSIYNVESINKINELQTKYKIAKKEQEIQLHETKIKAQKKMIYYIAFISIAILFFSIVFFIQKTKQKSANKELVRKNLEIVEYGNKLMDTKNELENAILMLKQKNIITKEPDLNNKYSTYKLPEAHKQELLNTIIHLFEHEKKFMEKDLSIDKLSKQMDTNRTYISQVVNDVFNKSFSDFLNEYRVKEARQLLSDPNYKHYSIAGIASYVGFASPTTFYRCFKKFTGITPSFYIKTLKAK